MKIQDMIYLLDEMLPDIVVKASDVEIFYIVTTHSVADIPHHVHQSTSPLFRSSHSCGFFIHDLQFISYYCDDESIWFRTNGFNLVEDNLVVFYTAVYLHKCPGYVFVRYSGGDDIAAYKCHLGSKVVYQDLFKDAHFFVENPKQTSEK